MGEIRLSSDTGQPPEYPLSRRPQAPPANHLGAAASPVLANLSAPRERVLAGRYRVEATIGKGSMGTVFRARDLRAGTLCAIKMITQTALLDEEAFQRFANEATVIAQLFHPNIVEVREFRRDENGWPFLVMELLLGADLHSHLAARRRLPLERVQSVVRQVASAIHAAHSLGIVHRDIKPRNIFLAQQGGANGGVSTEIVKVVDFGLAKILGGKHQTAAGDILGTPEYLAPEGTTGRSSMIDERTDQWALAVTAYRMLAGQLPFEDDDVFALLRKIREEPPPLISSVEPNLPDYVLRTLAIALSKQKAERFPSVLEFARALCGLPTGFTVLRSVQPLRTAPRAVPAEPPPPTPPAETPTPTPTPTPEPEQSLDPMRQTQQIDPGVLNQLLVLSQSAERPVDSPGPPTAAPLVGPESLEASLALAGASSVGQQRPRQQAQTVLLLLLLLAGLAVVALPSILSSSERSWLAELPAQPLRQPEGPAADRAVEATPATAPTGPEQQRAAAVDRGVASSLARSGELAPAEPTATVEPSASTPEKRPPGSAARRSLAARADPPAPAPLAIPPAESPQVGPEPVPAAADPASAPLPPISVVNRAQVAPPPATLGTGGLSPGSGQKKLAAFERGRKLEPIVGPNPRVPSWTWNVLGKKPFIGMYQLCLDTSGNVERVNVLSPNPPADEAIVSTLRTWKFAPQASTICIVRTLSFEPTL